MKKLLVLIVGLQLLTCNLPLSTCRACTSIIVSGKATADGRPVMFKNRDTDCLDNRVERYQGKNYAFIGLVNAPRKTGEVWAGINEAGFCIMNTASYNIKDDNVPDKQMDDFRRVMDCSIEEGGLVDQPLSLGERVRVTKGALRGVEGHVLELLGRTYVVVGLLGCIWAKAKVPRAYLEKVG
jgi:hypothetical protein